MMMQRLSAGLSETPYQAIARVAGHASPRRLLLLLAASVAALAIAATSAGKSPLPALAVGCASAAVASAALWGFAAHAAEHHPTRALRLLEWLLAGTGTALAALAAVALMLALLGQPWNL